MMGTRKSTYSLPEQSVIVPALHALDEDRVPHHVVALALLSLLEIFAQPPGCRTLRSVVD